MKLITISNGETRMGYELNDLGAFQKEHVIDSTRDLLESLEEEEDYGDYISDDEVADFIEVNRYLYDESGQMFNIHYRVANNVIVDTVYKVGSKEYQCTIVDC
jgi:hypothetical protein